MVEEAANIGELRSLDGLYRAGFQGSLCARIAFFMVRSGKIAGANVDNDIHFSGFCTVAFNGQVIVELRPQNRSQAPVELVTGFTLLPDEAYEFRFAGALRDLGSRITFQTLFGPIDATIERIAAL